MLFLGNFIHDAKEEKYCRLIVGFSSVARELTDEEIRAHLFVYSLHTDMGCINHRGTDRRQTEAE